MPRGYARGRRAECCGDIQGATELSAAGCSREQRGVPLVDATNEQATLIEDEDANNSKGNDGAAVVNAAVVNLQVPAQETNAQRSEVPLADALTSRRKGGKRKRTDS